MVLAALLAWQLFSTSFADMASSLVTNAAVISKIYFPRIIVPLGVLAVALVDFAISGVIYVGLAIWYGFYPDWRIVSLPLFIALGVLAIWVPDC